MAIAIDTVCTDAVLEQMVGGRTNLQRLLPDGWANAQNTRQRVLRRVLQRLAANTPPTLEANIADPSELQHAVAAGTLGELFANAATGDGDVFMSQAKRWDREYREELANLRPTTAGGHRPGPMTITMHRR